MDEVVDEVADETVEEDEEDGVVTTMTVVSEATALVEGAGAEEVVAALDVPEEAVSEGVWIAVVSAVVGAAVCVCVETLVCTAVVVATETDVGVVAATALVVGVVATAELVSGVVAAAEVVSGVVATASVLDVGVVAAEAAELVTSVVGPGVLTVVTAVVTATEAVELPSA